MNGFGAPARRRLIGAALGGLLVLVVAGCSDKPEAATVSTLGARGDAVLPTPTESGQIVARSDGSIVESVPSPDAAVSVEPTPLAEAIAIPEVVNFDIPEFVTNDQLATANADPVGLAEAYLSFRLRDAELTMGQTAVSVSPGEAHVAHAVSWSARSPRGDASGVVLVRSSGPNEYWVSEALTDGVELADLSLTVGAGGNELQGFIRSEGPFAVEIFAAEPGGNLVGTPIENSVGQLEVRREAAPGAWFSIRVTDNAAEPLHVSEVTTFHDAQTTPQVSSLQLFRNESIEQWMIRFDGAPSQADDQAAERGVPAAIAALPLSSRLDLGAGVSVGSAWAEIGRNDRWTVSRLPFSVEQELRGTGAITEPGPLFELVRLGGGETQPLALLDSVPLGGLRPSWVQGTASAVYAGRNAGSESFIVRIDVPSGAAKKLASPDVQPAVPNGWNVASREQLDLIESLDESSLDLSVIDHLLTLPPLR